MSNGESKTGSIALLCLTIVILGLFLFIFKIEACKPSSTSTLCKDEFYELNDDNNYGRNQHACDPGARVELVGPPVYPKHGVLCHCINSPGAASASGAVPTP